MKFKAEIDVMPLEAILDPQGKAVSQNMPNIGLRKNYMKLATCVLVSTLHFL
jgi:phosphoribosylformylglycinamidine (FGAM) synthase PurS component